MIRPLRLLALIALVSLPAVTPAAAGSYYSGCPSPCAPPVYSGCASPCYSGCNPCAPSYVANQGPVYYGPGVVTAPSGVYGGCASPCSSGCANPCAPAAYPYVGYDYPYPYYRRRHWHRPPMVYAPHPGPRVVVSTGYRMPYRAPRRAPRTVDPGYK